MMGLGVFCCSGLHPSKELLFMKRGISTCTTRLVVVLYPVLVTQSVCLAFNESGIRPPLFHSTTFNQRQHNITQLQLHNTYLLFSYLSLSSLSFPTTHFSSLCLFVSCYACVHVYCYVCGMMHDMCV
ncbi:MAG: hypothetical protein J3R72DRAFT_226252 [Linnemannia gamsii]|nr:MAG: hypothetical protein J3R72DRAFT_226252 [Linnemannia gamsii]